MITVGWLGNEVIYLDSDTEMFYKESKNTNGFIQLLTPVIASFLTIISEILNQILFLHNIEMRSLLLILSSLFIYFVSRIIYFRWSNHQQNHLKSILIEDISPYIKTYLVQSWGQIIFMLVFLVATIIFGVIYLVNSSVLLMFHLSLVVTLTIQFYYNPFKKKRILKKLEMPSV